MSITIPESMDDLLYFTRRKLENDGRIMAWVYRPVCEKCKKGKMGKPVDQKTGRPKVRSKEYVCTECGYEVPKDDLEPSLFLEVKYTCPHCNHEDETTTPYKRKTYKGVPSYVFLCGGCGEKIAITKKMKKPKPKKKK
ncbi:MAG: hypothetical protein ACQESC_03935 [Nanobdellota archaeon]